MPGSSNASAPLPDSRWGRLFVVATPIGNLSDISERAARVLCEVSLVAAEDTRHSRKLLQHVGSAAPCVSLHQHNEQRRAEELIERLQAGDDVALISDAGTPLVSDPGYLLLRTVCRTGIATVPIPGPSALTAALSVAALPTERFCFEGFLPARDKARKATLRKLREEPRTLVFFEAPHRIVAALRDLCEIFGGSRHATLARELTKRHETVRHGDLTDLRAWLDANPDKQRGEFVILVAGTTSAAESLPDARRALEVLLEELPPPQAARIAAKLTGESRRSLYQLALQLAQES